MKRAKPKRIKQRMSAKGKRIQSAKSFAKITIRSTKSLRKALELPNVIKMRKAAKGIEISRNAVFKIFPTKTAGKQASLFKKSFTHIRRAPIEFSGCGPMEISKNCLESVQIMQSILH